MHFQDISLSILLNNEPSGFFNPSDGQHQGDPLSPFLFILCMEVLSRRLVYMQDQESLVGLKLGQSFPKINHLFFADDTVFFFMPTLASSKILY